MIFEKRTNLRRVLLASTVIAGFASVAAFNTAAIAQDQDADDEVIEEVIVTGTRIQNPNLISASPVTVIDMEELNRTFTPNIERVFRDLPITIPGDGENVNNGTAGQATIDLRGLGTQRSLLLIDGKRLNPYDINGVSSTDVIPMIMLERVDVITGGASAVYGSDAMSGAINFILRSDFEGVEVDAGYQTTHQGGGDLFDVSLLWGANIEDGRGNVTFAMSFTSRNAVLLGDRDFGQFGVSTSTGSGLGEPPAEPTPDCSGNTTFTTAHSTGVGSTTAIPGTLQLPFGNYQFRDDGTLGADRCARFNFNPFNYYQTPQKRWQVMTTAHYDITDTIETYTRVGFTQNISNFRIAPSGTFGQPFLIPFANPFFGPQAQALLIADFTTFAAANAGVLPGDTFGFEIAGITDNNSNNVIDVGDSFTAPARRRTIELGARTGEFAVQWWQMVWGFRGEVPGFEGWDFDLSWQRGQSEWRETRDGFTNLTNLAAAINTVSATECITPQGVVTDAPCTPINVFGPAGSITDEQRDSGFFIALATDLRNSQQTIISASVSGELGQLRSPMADNALSLAFGVDYLKMDAQSRPDECLKLPPASCQGGAGGNRLPVSASFRAWEGYGEMIFPLIEGREYVEQLSLEAGFRYSRYNPQGNVETWKAGLSWQVTDNLRFRYMEQSATRVPNIAEIGTPVTTGLDNANFDPCSVGNPNPIDATLAALCIATGVPASLVGLVPDIIVGQVNQFSGTDFDNLPNPETARTRTVGVVYQPELGGMFLGTTISLDYYDIKITDFIDTPSGQEAFDLCYVDADPVACSGIVRINGALNISGSGLPGFITNFDFRRAEGIELLVNTNYDFEDYGRLSFRLHANYYLTNEFQTTPSSGVVDCKGIYGTSCDPVPRYRHTARLSWYLDQMDVSILWRRLGGMTQQIEEQVGTFEAFKSVNAQNYFDLSFGYQLTENVRFEGLVRNLANKNPPILGNQTGSTAFNSGNTFPSLYDVLGRVYAVNVRASF